MFPPLAILIPNQIPNPILIFLRGLTLQHTQLHHHHLD